MEPGVVGDGSDVCRHCGANNANVILDYASGDTICAECGYVMQEHGISAIRDWSNYPDDDNLNNTNKARAERASINADGSAALGTSIASTDYTGTQVSSGTTKSLAHAVAVAESTGTSVSKSLKPLVQKMNDFSDALQLPLVTRHTARNILTRYERKRPQNMKNKQKEALVAAAVVLACKYQHASGVTMKDVARATGIAEKDVKNAYKTLSRDHDVIAAASATRKSTKEQVEELIESICHKMSQPFAVATAAKQLVPSVIDFTEGKKPSSVAAAILKFLMKIQRVPFRSAHLLDAASISVNTLRNVYRVIIKNVERLPADYRTAYEEYARISALRASNNNNNNSSNTKSHSDSDIGGDSNSESESDGNDEQNEHSKATTTNSNSNSTASTEGAVT